MAEAQTYGWDYYEAYAWASNASNFSGHSGGSLTTLCVVAKSAKQSQLGAALAKLRAEYDAAVFQPRPAKFGSLAAKRSYESGQSAAFNRLHSLPLVRS